MGKNELMISFLGTNGWYDSETGHTLCILIDTPEYAIVLDAGSGFSRLDRYLENKPVYLLLSHFHLDHVVGLHTLAKFSFRHGLHILGPTGIKETLGVLLNQPFTKKLSDLPFKVQIDPLPEGADKVPFKLECEWLVHSSPILGYRIEVAGKVIAYCTDTGYCPNAIKLAREADLLLAECTQPSGESDPSWPHLNPELAATLAKEANARRLALIHFDASRYPTLEHRKQAEQAARRIFTESFASIDDTAIYL